MPDNQRGTGDPKTADRGLGRREYYVIQGDRGYEVVATERPRTKQPIVLDEMKVTPSAELQHLQTVDQAKRLVDRAKAGRPVSDAEAKRLQQRLLTKRQRQEVAGGGTEPPNADKDLVDELGEARRSILVRKATDMLAKAKSGGKLAPKAINSMQVKLLEVEQQDQIRGQSSLGMQQLAIELGEVRRGQLVREAQDVLHAVSQHRRFSSDHVKRLQQALVGIERTDQLVGRESEGFRLAVELAEVRQQP